MRKQSEGPGQRGVGSPSSPLMGRPGGCCRRPLAVARVRVPVTYGTGHGLHKTKKHGGTGVNTNKPPVYIKQRNTVAPPPPPPSLRQL